MSVTFSRRRPVCGSPSACSSHPLVPLGLSEAGGEPQLGNKGQSFPDGEVRKKTVVLADVSDALLHQLRRVGLPVNQNLAGCHRSALIAAHRSTPVQLKISSRLLLPSQSVPTHVTSVLHLLRLPLPRTSLVPGHNLRTQVGRGPDQSSLR
ncbi:hypothetical protein EYF80_025447 [Liparis tanakae]|uniref:Uncharacterized protein n=1 Tax=Liparis tanakae TaxID=230148 RepID=A0A4Z2HEM1_9TELE|nr:hypothetical protein EYF80_025447 [Liparis tanakae]